MSEAIKSIYLAGKIAHADWRSEIVNEDAFHQWGNDVYCSNKDINGSWPVCKNAIFDKYAYVGPFFVECGHGCFYGEDNHGVGTRTGGEFGSHYDDLAERREATNQRSLGAIGVADLVFAWIDCIDCYGTIAEIGYAKALQKRIWIAGPKCFRDLWFVYEMADQINLDCMRPSILKHMLVQWEREFLPSGSPIERAFWSEWLSNSSNDFLHPLIFQHPIGRYRVDFAHIATKTAIELDGFASHSSTEDIANDRKRQREIEAMGWHVIRFGGKEVYHDAAKCVDETLAFLARFEHAESGRR